MTSNVRWEEMFPDELDATLDRHPLVYLTYGLCEPHGLHNVLGLDALKAHALACRAAEVYGGIVAPPSFWHIHEIGYEAPWSERAIGDRIPWLTSVPPWVFFKNVLYHLRAVAALGFHAAIVLTGHGGGQETDLKQVADVFMRHSPLQVWAGGDFEIAEECGITTDHAGRWETSVLWALRPEFVDMSRLAQGPSDVIGRIMATGADAGAASRLWGEEVVATEVSWLGRKAGALLADYQPSGPRDRRAPGNPQGALTFGETELIWRTEIELHLPDFVSMNMWPCQERVDPASVWSANEMSHRGLFEGR